MTRIFLIGATGYIGGDALYAIADGCPHYEIACLVKDSDTGALIASQYAKVRLVFGGIDDVNLIEDESRKADVVCYFTLEKSTASIEAITRGLVSREDSPGFLILTSDVCHAEDGISSQNPKSTDVDHVYDDMTESSELVSLSSKALQFHFDRDMAQNGGNLQTAIVAPAYVYGKGRGPDVQSPMQVAELCKAILERGRGLRAGADQTVGSFVNIADLSDLLLLLIKEAASGGCTAEWPGKPDVWGKDGFYFAEHGEHALNDVVEWITAAALKKGLIKSGENEEDNGIAPSSVVSRSGANPRVRARRAREVLKWEPTMSSLQDEMTRLVESEARALDVVKGDSFR